MARNILIDHQPYPCEVDYAGMVIRGEARSMGRGKIIVECFIFDLPREYRDRLSLPKDAVKLFIETEASKIRRLSK